eukprot:2622490-Karenia_brevis.AAC.1
MRQQSGKNPAIVSQLAHTGQADVCNPFYQLHLALEMARQCQGGLDYNRCQGRRWIYICHKWIK